MSRATMMLLGTMLFAHSGILRGGECIGHFGDSEQIIALRCDDSLAKGRYADGKEVLETFRQDYYVLSATHGATGRGSKVVYVLGDAIVARKWYDPAGRLTRAEYYHGYAGGPARRALETKMAGLMNPSEDKLRAMRARNEARWLERIKKNSTPVLRGIDKPWWKLTRAERAYNREVWRRRAQEKERRRREAWGGPKG